MSTQEKRRLRIAKGLCSECCRSKDHGEQGRYCVRCKERNRERDKTRDRKGELRRLKSKIMNHYGDCRCACCGESNIEFLQIDHIHNDGAKHRREIGIKRHGVAFYKWLLKNAFPPGFKVLCANCNMAKGFYGECPHERQRRLANPG
jgi:hypothetical protein